MRTLVAILVLLFPVLGLAAPTPAGELSGDSFQVPDLADREQIRAGGWVKVHPNVLERHLADGSVERLAYGPEGLRWQLEHFATRAAELRWDLEMTGDPDIASALAELEARIERTRLELDETAVEKPGGVESVTGESTVGCSIVITRTATAGPTNTGPTSYAKAAFSDTCATYGCVFTDCYASGYLGGSYRSYYEDDGEYCGYYSASATCNAWVEADTNCYSDSYARVRVIDSAGQWVYFTRTASNNLCRNPLTVSITGPSSVWVAAGTCEYPTWTANPSRAVSSYAWTWNGTSVGSSSTYTRTICAALRDVHYTATLAVTVSDGTTSASASKAVTVDLEGSGGPICCDPQQQ